MVPSVTVIGSLKQSSSPGHHTTTTMFDYDVLFKKRCVSFTLFHTGQTSLDSVSPPS